MSMDNINLEDVALYASLNYSVQQICAIMDIDLDQADHWMQHSDHPFCRAYWKGYYETDVKLRHSIFKLAFAGSSPAQALALRLREQNETRSFYEQ